MKESDKGSKDLKEEYEQKIKSIQGRQVVMSILVQALMYFMIEDYERVTREKQELEDQHEKRIESLKGKKG